MKHHLLGRHILFILQTSHGSRNNSATELCCKDSYQYQIPSLRSYTGKSPRMEQTPSTHSSNREKAQANKAMPMLCLPSFPPMGSFKKLSTKTQLGKTGPHRWCRRGRGCRHIFLLTCLLACTLIGSEHHSDSTAHQGQEMQLVFPAA